MLLLRSLLLRVSREPVLAGAAFLAWSHAWWPGASEATKLAIAATVAFGQRAFSTAKATAEEATAEAHINGQNELAAYAASEPALVAKKPSPRRNLRK